MAKFELKSKVQFLRKRGMSLKQIMREAGISKSTASLWCRDIVLSEAQRQALKKKMIEGGHAGRLKGAEANHLKKVESQELARMEAAHILRSVSERDRLVSGIALYWAEGSKAESTFGFIFVNSDPAMISFMYRWLLEVMRVSKEDIYLHVSINEIHKPRIEKVLRFWSNLLDLPRSQFAKTFFMKVAQKKIYENHDVHYGVCRLGVRRSSLLKYKILALIDLLKMPR